MKFLILTQYFPPETGAPQNRLFWLAKSLINKGYDVSVLTAMPNYPQMKIYEGYRHKFYHFEIIEGIKIHRCYIYVSSKKSILKRLLNYFSFVKTSFIIGLFKLNQQDFIFCESPPLFLGITALLLKKLKGAKLIFNVSDLWPESAEKLGIVTNKFLLHVSTKLEETLYRNSEFISCQTQGIVNDIHNRFPDKKIFWLKNGIDTNQFAGSDNNINQNSWRKENGFKVTDFIIIYAGIIGHAQGLEVILNAANHLREFKDIRFILIGNGPEKDKLLELKSKLELNNVTFHDSVSKIKMLSIIKETDAAVIPLKNIELFKGAIPSKIFENLALRKPILLGVEGEAKELFIDEGKCGLNFIPEDDKDLAEKTLMFYNSPELVRKCGENAYNYGVKNFSIEKIAEDFADFIQTKPVQKN